MADDDRDTDRERARLEGIAWGAGSSEAEAARARIALADLQRGRVRHGDFAAPVGSVPPPAVTSTAGASAAVEADPLADGGRVGGGGADLPSEDLSGEPAAGAERGPSPTAAGPRPWRRVLRLVRSARARPWLAGGAAAAVVVAFGTGLVIGTVHPVVPSSPSVTPTAGSVTLQQLLDAPQTYADQLPGSIEAPVSLHSTRLVFTNRSLSGDDAATPWNVWAGVGTDRSTICLVATANRLEASTACYPREDALHGSVSLSAESLSGTLTVELSGGGVQGRVTNAF
jgi:hypothetical protein